MQNILTQGIGGTSMREIRGRARRIAGLLLIAFAAGSLTGCNKLLANFSLNQAKKRVAEAEKNDAQKFDPEGLTNVSGLINATEQNINSQNFKDARLKAKDAARAAKEMLERTKQTRANFLKSETNRWIDILNKNEGQAENAKGYQDVLDGNQAGLTAFDKSKWDTANQHFAKAVGDAQFLLEVLKNKAEQGVKEVEGMKANLIKEGAPEHYPEAIIEIDEFSKRLQDLITNKFEYRTALITRDQARQAAEAGVLKTKEIKSDKLLRQIEAQLSTALGIGADIYAPRTLEGVSREFEELLKQFYEQKYDSVLTTGPTLLPKAQALIVETQKESAHAKIDAVTKAISSLVEGQAKIYLPGRVEQIEGMLKQAREKFDAQTYTETEQICVGALEEEKRVVDAFNSLAQKEIQDASGALTVAQGIYTRMQDIFSKPSPAVSGDDEALEKAKGAMREELRAKLDNAGLELGIATLKREEKSFAGAIEVAKKVVAEGEQVVQQTYRVVTHNAVQEMNNEVTRYERDGGRKYAPGELDKTQKMLTETREILKGGDYRKAVDAANQTKAQLEILAQELARVAVGKIETAHAKLDAAERLGAKTYQAQLLDQGKITADEARRNLDGESLKRAIELAEEATTAAEKAGQDAIRQWTEDEMRRTEILLARAREAGAEIYAPAMLDDASNELRNAQSLAQSGNLAEAQTVAASAAAGAEKALYARVIQAEDEIAQAQRSGAWTYESERLAQAIVNAKIARESLDRNDYKKSAVHASQSIETAHQSAQAARNAGFKDRMTALEAKVNTASEKGVAYYQISDLSKIVGTMSQLRTEFEPDGYEESMKTIDLLEARLQGLVEGTPSVLQELVDHMNERMGQLENRGARIHTPDLIAEASRKIKFAQLDFSNQKYRSSFTNAKEALKKLDEISLRLDERDYDKRVGEYFAQLNTTLSEFSPVLNMGSPVLMRMASGPTGRNQALAIVSASKPGDLKQKISDVAAQVSLLQPPPTRRTVQDASMAMLNTAKSGASGFEKLLILDRYSGEEARQIIQTAYVDIRTARDKQREIQRMLETTTTQANQPAVRALQIQP